MHFLDDLGIDAVGMDEFLCLGIVAVAYGLAQLCAASAFLAVFAAGLALQRVEEQPGDAVVPVGPSAEPLATHPEHASATMLSAVQGFNQQLEKVAELAIVLLVGAMLSYTEPWPDLWWLIPLLLVALRPLAVFVGTVGEPMAPRQRWMTAWFGIRGIGSVFYLMFAIRHGVAGALAQQLVTITLLTVAASIVLHGVSMRPLMRRYRPGKQAPP